MNVLPGLAALALGAAVFLSGAAIASERPGLDKVARAIAALAAFALLPGWSHPASRPVIALSVATAFLAPRPLSYVLSSTAAAWLCLRSGPFASGAPWAVASAALAVPFAASAVSFSVLARLAAGAEHAWMAAGGGLSAVVFLITIRGGDVLRWRYAIGPASDGLDLPGAGLILGLALLAALCGTLLLASAALTRSPGAASARFARLAGQRCLVLAAGLAVLAVGLIVGRGLALRADLLGAGAREVAGLILVIELLVLALVFLSGRPVRDAPAGLEARAEAGTRLSAGLSCLTAAVAGLEGWLREGSYATSFLAAAMAAALLGLGAVQPTRLPLARRAALLAGLVWLLAQSFIS